MSDETIEIKTKGLDQLIKSLKVLPVARVGILGPKDKRHVKGSSNAAIGAKHEFGSAGMPRRSFLRMPITENLQAYLDKSHIFDEEVLKSTLKEGTLSIWMRKVAFIAETIVKDAFASGGFGKWPGWRGGYQSKTGLLLVDTTQLRGSISSEVK